MRLMTLVGLVGAMALGRASTIDPCSLGPCVAYSYTINLPGDGVSIPATHFGAAATGSDSQSSMGASADWSGTLNFQNLHLEADVAAPVTLNVAQIDVDLEFIDYLLFTSSTLPVGTPVDFMETFVLHDTISQSGPGNNCSLGAEQEVQASSDGILIIDANCASPLTPDQRTQSVILHSVTMAPGSPYAAQELISANLYMQLNAGGLFGVTSASIDASNTSDV